MRRQTYESVADRLDRHVAAFAAVPVDKLPPNIRRLMFDLSDAAVLLREVAESLPRSASVDPIEPS